MRHLTNVKIKTNGFKWQEPGVVGGIFQLLTIHIQNYV